MFKKLKDSASFISKQLSTIPKTIDAVSSSMVASAQKMEVESKKNLQLLLDEEGLTLEQVIAARQELRDKLSKQ